MNNLHNTNKTSHEGGEDKITPLNETTTTFEENADFPDSSVSAPLVSTEQELKTMLPTRDLAEFFSKPYLIGTTTFSTTNVVNEVLLSGLITPAIYTEWVNKYRGYGLFRGHPRFHIEINGQPFQAGRLLFTFTPTNCASDATRGLHLTGRTGLPNVELDIHDSSAVFSVPYRSCTNWYPLPGSESAKYISSFGYFELVVLSLLRVGTGDTSVDVSIYLSWTDAEFAAPIVPQSGGLRAKRVKGKRVAVMEEEKMEKGPVTKALEVATDVATYATGIPLLSSIAWPLSWVGGAATKVASYYGWAKPNNNSSSSFMIERTFRNMTNSQGMTSAEPLSLTCDPSVQVLPGFAGTDIDEMSFDFVKSKSVFYKSFDWTVTDPTATLLFNQLIGPKEFGNSVSATISGFVYNMQFVPPFHALSDFFRYYTGDLIMTFKFVKTNFHSGRCEIVYQPQIGPEAGVIEPTLTQSTFTMREIADVRDTDEICIRLPYLGVTPMKDINDQLGRVTVRTLNDLRAPSTCSGTISVLVYVSAAPNFELSGPVGGVPTVWTPQGGDRTKICKVVGNIDPIEDNSPRLATCAGERFTSIKQLISRYSQTSLEFTGSCSLSPFMLQGISVSPTASNYVCDNLSYFASAFTFWRGSVRILISTDTTKSFVAKLRTFAPGVPTFVTAGGAISIPTVFGVDSGRTVWDCPNASKGLEVLVPYYSSCSRSSVYGLRGQDSIPGVALDLGFGDALAKGRVYRAAGDDYQFGCFIGFGPRVFSKTPV